MTRLQVSGEETLKAAFEDYKRQQDQMVEQRYAEIDARLDAISIDFDEELYPHMLTAIAGRRQAFADVVSAGIAKGMSEGLKHEVEHGHARRTKKRSRIVCRTHVVGSAHHAMSDRVPVSAPIVVPQGLALLLVDAATQTESDDAEFL
nr:hypothetical protein [Tanacetum cinerariifolium]